MGYRAVIFDLWGTLAPNFPPPFERSLRDMAGALGVEPAAFRRLWVHDTSRPRMTGAYPTIEANLEHIARLLGVSVSAGQLAQAAQIRMPFYRAALVPRADAVATLTALRARGLRLGLISDCSCEAPLLWPTTPFASLIEAPVFSCVEGTKKPDPRLYLTACARLSASPTECVYVADGFSQELSGARALGMQAVLIAVPGEASPDPTENEGASWTGPRIAALQELTALL